MTILRQTTPPTAIFPTISEREKKTKKKEKERAEEEILRGFFR